MPVELVLATIGITGQLYSGAIQAYVSFQAAIDFPESAEKLVLQLEVERIRLQLWGRNSGVDQGILHPNISPFEPLIKDILNKVTNLLRDSDKLKEDYGLVSSMDGGRRAATVTQRSKAMDQVKSVLRAILPVQDRKECGDARQATASNQIDQDLVMHKGVSSFGRIRWAISSQSRFEGLIRDIRGFTNNLNELLRESQQISLHQEWRRIELQTVADIESPNALRMVQETTEGDANCRGMLSMARRKSIVIAKRGMTQDLGPQDSTVEVLSKHDFHLPNNFQSASRCFALYKPRTLDAHVLDSERVLIEKKRYHSDISSDDKIILLFRLRRLISLSNSPPGDQSETGLLFCLGYWSELESNCWCLAYRFPFFNTPHPLNTMMSIQPRSLLDLLQPDAPKPPLESRLMLASSIAAIFSQLYGSKWLHKGVRSENILFPTSADGTYDRSKPLVAGFEYSRQYTELASVDRRQYDILHAIYHHPQYQGSVARGYRMGYDIYSFGLILAEIAWWVPLESFLQAIPREASKVSMPSVQGLQSFGAEEAAELRGMVLSRLEKELAFRVGTAYKEVVQWCLSRGGQPESSDNELAVEFHMKVVVPLENTVFRRN